MRYLPLTSEDRAAMLARIGAGSIDDLYVDVPSSAQLSGLLDLPLRQDRKSTRLNSSHIQKSRMPSSA